MANAKHEDAVMKMGFDYFRNTILKTLGIDYQYEEIGPTELVELTIQSLYMDFTSRSFFADSSYMLSFSVLCSCVCSRLISPSVSSWHKQDNTLMHQSPGHIQRRTPYNF